MSQLPFKPRSLWVVVQQDAERDKTEGGLVVPEKSRVKMNRGTVLGVGNGMMTDHGSYRTVEGLNVGDVVMWQDGQSYDIDVQGKPYTFVPAGSIVLVETPTPAPETV